MCKKTRGVIYFLFLVVWAWRVDAPLAQTEMFRCVMPNGSVVFSDRAISEQCRKMEELPPLLRAPEVPPPSPGAVAPEEKTPPSSEPVQVPTPGRGRRIDPPSDAAILIRDVKAVPNFNSLLGIAMFQATMQLENGDSDWTAEQVCIDVRFRDVTLIFLDVRQVGCLDGLKPLDTRSFTVTYTGLIPPRLFPIMAEATVAFVKWVK
jgi:hypothetical protein